MKKQLVSWVIPAVLLAGVGISKAQTIKQNAGSVTSGGAIVSGTGYSGNVTIGTVWLPSKLTGGGGVNDTKPMSQSDVIPNPSAGEFRIVSPEGAGELQRIEILDEAGHLVSDVTHSATTEADGIHVKSSGLASGTYFVRVVRSNGSASYKVVIDKVAH